MQVIYSTGSAFAALHNDGSVTAWGHSGNGGTLPGGGVSDVSIIHGATLCRSSSILPHDYGLATAGVSMWPTSAPSSQPTMQLKCPVGTFTSSDGNS